MICYMSQSPLLYQHAKALRCRYSFRFQVPVMAKNFILENLLLVLRVDASRPMAPAPPYRFDIGTGRRASSHRRRLVEIGTLPSPGQKNIGLHRATEAAAHARITMRHALRGRH